MSSLLVVVVKSHLFPQFVHLNRERGKVAAVTSSGHWGERRDCSCQSRVDCREYAPGQIIVIIIYIYRVLARKFSHSGNQQNVWTENYARTRMVSH